MGAPVFLVHAGLDGKDMLNPLNRKAFGGSSARPGDWFEFVGEVKPTGKGINHN